MKLGLFFFTMRRTDQYCQHISYDRRLLNGLFDRRCRCLMQANCIEEAVFDNFIKKPLIIWQRLVSINVWIAQFNKHGADVLMLQLNRCLCSVVEKFLKIAIMLGLVKWFVAKFHCKHLEIIRDSCFHFFV